MDSFTIEIYDSHSNIINLNYIKDEQYMFQFYKLISLLHFSTTTHKNGKNINEYYKNIKENLTTKTIRDLDIYRNYLLYKIEIIDEELIKLNDDIIKIKTDIYNLNDNDITYLSFEIYYSELTKKYMNLTNKKNYINDMIFFIDLNINNRVLTIDEYKILDYIYVKDDNIKNNELNYNKDGTRNNNIYSNYYNKNNLYTEDYYYNNNNKEFKHKEFNKDGVLNYDIENGGINTFYTEEIRNYFEQIHNFKYIRKNINDTFVELKDKKDLEVLKKKLKIYNKICIYEQDLRKILLNKYIKTKKYDNEFDYYEILYNKNEFNITNKNSFEFLNDDIMRIYL